MKPKNTEITTEQLNKLIGGISLLADRIENLESKKDNKIEKQDDKLSYEELLEENKTLKSEQDALTKPGDKDSIEDDFVKTINKIYKEENK